jgi:hypothetical protein
MKTLEKNISVSKDIADTYNAAITGGYDLYACIGRSGRYGFNGKSHYELKPDNAVPYEGKLYAATPQYAVTLKAQKESPAIEPIKEPIEQEVLTDLENIAQDGENAPEAACGAAVEEVVEKNIAAEDGANAAEISVDSEAVAERVAEENPAAAEEVKEADLTAVSEVVKIDEAQLLYIQLLREKGELKVKNERLKAQVHEYKPLAEKYLANKDLIDSVEQKISELKHSYETQIWHLKTRLDRIKAVIEET